MPTAENGVAAAPVPEVPRSELQELQLKSQQVPDEFSN